MRVCGVEGAQKAVSEIKRTPRIGAQILLLSH